MEPLITVKEAASLLRVAPITIIRWCRNGTIVGASKINNSRRLGFRMPRSSVLALLEPGERDALQDTVPA